VLSASPCHHRLKTFGGWRDKQLADGTARKFRNHLRGMLFLFKGTPSTGPYWTPDESTLVPLPDDPPF